MKKNRKPLTIERLELSIYRLRRDGFLKPGGFITWRWSTKGKVYATLRFTVGEDRLTICTASWKPKYDIALTRTNCTTGGTRPWFKCPACGRRCAILYAKHDFHFTCRECCDLSYESKNLSDAWRLLRQSQKVQRKLDWHGPDGERPKWMHETTYQRLVERHEDYDRRAMVAMAKALKL